MLTLRKLLERLEQTGDKEKAMDMPISILARDPHNNTEIGTVYDDYVQIFLPRSEGETGSMRIKAYFDCGFRKKAKA